MLFEKPLYEIIRPTDFDAFFGHKEIIRNLSPQNIILWGPPGVGKTTIAYILSKKWNKPFYQLSAVLSGKKEVKDILEKIEREKIQSIIFIDEIHAFNRAQQNIFLQHIEKGLIILIGATTENPSFEIISPLLSRATLIKLEKLLFEDLTKIFYRAEQILKKRSIILEYYDNFLEHIIMSANGDARILLNNYERVAEYVLSKNRKKILEQDLMDALSDNTILYDKKYEEHYNQLSAFHKSLRGSDPDAALYWGFRMLEAGEEPRNIFRRLIACASEDIGLADPNALTIAVSAWQSFEFLGRPEGDLSFAEAIVYIATAPKSNSIYKAIRKVKEIIKKEGYLPVPYHLRNPVTHLMKKSGYGKGYKYPHNYPFSYVKQEYLPEKIKNINFYKPKDIGFEREINKRLEWWQKIKEKEEK